jgi:hypothetical protein
VTTTPAGSSTCSSFSRANPATVAATRLDQSLAAQHRQGLTHRVLADAEVVGKIGLRAQLLPRRKNAVCDLGTQSGGDL